MIVVNACRHEPEEPKVEPHVLVLKWNQAYAAETKEKVETGLLWTLSFLGAELPSGSFRSAISWSDNYITIHLDRLGFTQQALNALGQLLPHFKQSGEYKQQKAIDVGRFVALTLNSSNHYYAITGIATTFNGFKQGKVFDVKQFVVTNSLISTNDRIFDLPDSTITNFENRTFISSECEGRIKDGKGRITSYEVKEQMRNGQFRFAVYDTLGNRLLAAKGNAGKPAKCLWCHESYIQPLWTEQTDEPGYYGAADFRRIVNHQVNLLNGYRKTLYTDLDYEKKQDHTLTELLYISFMEPSAERLASEWGMSVEAVKQKLSSMTTHTHSEFPFLGVLYDREDIDSYAPYSTIQPPNSAREKSAYEPDLIR